MKVSNDQILIALLGAIIVIGIAAYFVLGAKPAGPVIVNGSSVAVKVVYDQSCLKCPSTNPVINSLKNNGIPVGEWNNYDYNSTEGAELIRRYGISQVPAIVISENMMEYTYAKQTFSTVNFSKANGSYVIYLNPPYRNLSDGKVAGIVDMYLINDSTCSKCYDVLIHRDIIEQDFKVTLGDILVFDINYPIGQEFVDRYNITAVPTYILTQDAKYYPWLVKIWPSIGTIEDTGYFVFRNVSNVGLPYRNLTSGKIIEPA